MDTDIDKYVERTLYNARVRMEDAAADSLSVIGICGQCGHSIMSDEHYCETVDGYFCSEECFDEYYDIKHYTLPADKLLECGHRSGKYIDTVIGEFCSVECLKQERGFKEYGDKYIKYEP